jgi:hypothetical protein
MISSVLGNDYVIYENARDLDGLVKIPRFNHGTAHMNEDAVSTGPLTYFGYAG